MRGEKLATVAILPAMKLVVAALLLTTALGLFSPVLAQTPTPTVVDSPAVKVLTGLLAPQFQEEMNFITQALGANCNTCHCLLYTSPSPRDS